MRNLIATIMAVIILFTLAACGGAEAPTGGSEAETGTTQKVPTGVEDGVFTIAMECAYAPYNWTQNDDSNGAVELSNVPGSYANGYDVMIGKIIARR